MKEIFNFLLEASKLKIVKRNGWILRGVPRPETIGQHTFRVALMNWFLAETAVPQFNAEKILQISLIHDLCEVYAGDITPYWGLLPEGTKGRKEAFQRWVRFMKKTKEKRFEDKFKKEKDSLEKLLKPLSPVLRNELMKTWMEYEKMSLPEGRFVKQGDKIETLLQAVQYFGTKPNSLAVAWWEEVEGWVDQPVLLNFLVEIEKKFYAKEKADPMLDFMIEIGRLKSLPRRGWLVRGIKEPETIADHSFIVALMVWIFGRKKKINLRRALKMALIHEICAVYAGDFTPHDIYGRRWKWRSFWQERPRLSKAAKAGRFLEVYQKETKALKKLIAKLQPSLRQEISALWTEFNEKTSREGDFVDQVNCLATFIQAFQYWKEGEKIPIRAFNEQAIEFVSDPDLLELLAVLQKEIGSLKPAKKNHRKRFFLWPPKKKK